MSRFMVAAAGTAIVVAGLTGCSNNKSSTSLSSNSSTASASAASGSASPAAGQTNVTVDGQDQNIQGTVVCQSGNTRSGNIGVVDIGILNAATGAGLLEVLLSDADPPVVQKVGFSDVNGAVMGYPPTGPSQGRAQATKDGKSYKITGTVTGVDMTNPKPFDIDVTCP
jgi:lipoprotein LpqH